MRISEWSSDVCSSDLLMAPALFLMGIGPIARWRHATMITLAKRLRWALAVSVVAALAAPWLLGTWTPLISFGLFLALWIFSSAAVTLAGRLRSHPAPTAWARRGGQPGGVGSARCRGGGGSV